MTKIFISRVEISRVFATTSEKFGFSEQVVQSYEDDLLDLQERWEGQGFLEVFEPENHFAISYGMIKSSLSAPGAYPLYRGFYHARILSDQNDPLLIIKFKGEIVPHEHYDKAVMLTMIDHDLMFMPQGKKAPHLRQKQRKWVRYVIETELGKDPD